MLKPNFLTQTIESHALTVAFFSAALLITLLPVAFEACQHMIELQFGMFNSVDSGASYTENYIRPAAGAVKLLSILFVCVVVTRYFLHHRDLQVALKFKAPSLRAALSSLALIAALFGLVFFGAPALSAWITVQELAVPDEVLNYLPMIVLLAVFLPLQKPALRLFALTFNDAEVDIYSATLIRQWTRNSISVLFLLAVGPAMALHYYLNAAAIDKSLLLQVLILSTDSVLVGVMAVLLGTASWVSYRDAKKSVSEIDLFD